MELDEMTPCSLEVVSVAVCDTALVGELLLLTLGGEPGNRISIGSGSKISELNRAVDYLHSSQ